MVAAWYAVRPLWLPRSRPQPPWDVFEREFHVRRDQYEEREPGVWVLVHEWRYDPGETGAKGRHAPNAPRSIYRQPVTY